MNPFQQGLLLKQSQDGETNQLKELYRREDSFIEFDIDDTTQKQTRQTNFTKILDENQSASFTNIDHNTRNASNTEEVFTQYQTPQHIELNKQNLTRQNEYNDTITSSFRSNISSHQKECEFPLNDNLEMSFNGQDISPSRSRNSSFVKNRISKQSKHSKQMSIKSIQKMANEINNNSNSMNNINNSQKQSKNRIGYTSQFAKKQKTNNLYSFNLITKIMKKMLYFYRNYTYSGKTKHVNLTVVRKMINDKSDIQNSTKQKIKLDKFKQQWKQMQKQFWKLSIFQNKMINPQNMLSICLQIFFVAINFLYFLFLSILLVFAQNEIFSSYFDTYMLIQWILELFVKLNTAIFIKTSYIETRKDVVNIYFSKNVIFDILPMILLIIQTDVFILQYLLRIFSFIKLINTLKDKQQVEQQLLMILRNHYIVQLINLIIQLLFVGHVIACIWYLIAKIDLDYLDKEKSWMTLLTQEGDNWSKIYILSFYWSFTLMSTGSNIANTTLELYFTSFAILFTTICFGYIINTIGIILSDMNKQVENQRRDINIINNYMEKKDIPKTLQRRVNLDLENYYHKNLKSKTEEEKQVLNKISQELHEALKIEYNKNIFSEIKLLFDNFSEDSLKQLCLETEEVFYSPEQIIFKEGDLTSNLMFIVSGTVEIFSQEMKKKENNLQTEIFIKTEWGKQLERENSTQKLGLLKKGEIFGEQNFFTGMQRNESAKSKDFTTIIKIDRQQFIDIIKKKEKDFQTFCEIKDKLLFYNDYSSIKKACVICNSKFHLNNFCQLTHFNRDNSFTLQKFNKSLIQERNKNFVRKKQKIDFQTIIYDTGASNFCEDINKIWLKKNTLYSLNFQQQSNIDPQDESFDEREESKEFQNLQHMVDHQHHDLLQNKVNSNEKEASSLLSSQKGSQINKSLTNKHEYFISQKSLKKTLESIKFDKENNVSYNNPSMCLLEELPSKSCNNLQLIKRMHDNSEEQNNERSKRQSVLNNEDLFHLNDINLNVKYQYNEESKKKMYSSVERQLIPKSNKYVSIKHIPLVYGQSVIFDKNKHKQKFQNSQNSFPEQNKVLHIEWIFDQQKDFDSYFPSGNQKNVLDRLFAYKKQQNRKQNAKEFKNGKKLDSTVTKQIKP